LLIWYNRNALQATSGRNLREAISVEDLLADFSIVIHEFNRLLATSFQSLETDENVFLSFLFFSFLLFLSRVFRGMPERLRDSLAKGTRDRIVGDIR